MAMYKGMLVIFVLVVLAVLGWVLFKTLSAADVPIVPENPLYKDASATTSARVANLLSYMTLEEKIGQMALVEKNSILSETDIQKYGLGALLSGFGGKPENNTKAGWTNMIGGFVAQSKQSRLSIPVFYGVDAIHGHSNVPGFVVFPHFIGLGATGDEVLVREVAAATGQQMLSTGANWSYSPTYDMPTDIRWGRVYETFSDDPELVSKLGTAYIEGLQQQTTATSTISVLATPKHFVGAGAMVWDTSTNENFKIDQGVTPIDEERLRLEYLPPYQAAVDAGALSVMVGLNTWGDTKLAAQPHLIHDVLKGELGFSGFVVSDWYGVYEISNNDYGSAVTAINAGVDMVMLPFDYKKFVRNVSRAVKRDEIPESRIDDAVTRILTAKFATGLFDNIQKETEIDTTAQQALARKAVAQSAVLLKNEGSVLPLRTSGAKILVAGSAADDAGLQAGAWTIEWQGIAGNPLPGGTSILAGIQAAVGTDTEVLFSADGQFTDSGEKADIAIAVVGEKPYAEGWGDNQNPSLSSEDLAVIERLQEVSEKVVVILVTGRPLFITEELPKWDALVVAWLPGSEGAGMADVLFGVEPFTGTLPLPWPAIVSQLPIASDGTTTDGTPVLFKRYFGLE